MLALRAAKVNRLEHGAGCGRHGDIGKAHHGWSVTETRVGHCSAIGAPQHSEGVTRYYPLTRAGKPTTIAKLCPRDGKVAPPGYVPMRNLGRAPQLDEPGDSILSQGLRQKTRVHHTSIRDRATSMASSCGDFGDGVAVCGVDAGFARLADSSSLRVRGPEGSLTRGSADRNDPRRGVYETGPLELHSACPARALREGDLGEPEVVAVHDRVELLPVGEPVMACPGRSPVDPVSASVKVSSPFALKVTTSQPTGHLL